MNPTNHRDTGPWSDETEWRLQERAKDALDAPDGDAASADGMLADYRRIARALRTAPAERLPSNFAWQMAQRVSRAYASSRLDLRLERWLVRGLAVALGLAGLVAALVYGAAWLRALAEAGHDAGAWVALVAACMAASWAPEALRHWRRDRVAERDGSH